MSEDEINECTFPDCGCPEARLCMAKEPNDGAYILNRAPSKYMSKKIAQENVKRKLNTTP